MKISSRLNTVLYTFNKIFWFKPVLICYKQKVMILIIGAHKAFALYKAIEEGVNHMWTVSAFQQHPKTLMLCDEDATLELRVKTVKYFKVNNSINFRVLAFIILHFIRLFARIFYSTFSQIHLTHALEFTFRNLGQFMHSRVYSCLRSCVHGGFGCCWFWFTFYDLTIYTHVFVYIFRREYCVSNVILY